jgi:Cys-rich repeat protein
VCTMEGRCVQCQANADCTTTAKPFCGDMGQCVQCQHDTQCPMGMNCDMGTCRP